MDQAENLRKIMQQKEEQAKEAARVIAVTSGKGGVGKSSVSVNLAIQFARMGKSVVILDADFGLANVEVMFGVIPKYNLSDLLYNGRELKEIICEGPEGIQFISGGSGAFIITVPLDFSDGKRIFRFDAYVKAESAFAVPSIAIAWGNNKGRMWNRAMYVSNETVSPGQWTRLEILAEAPADATNAILFLQAKNADGGTVWFDDAAFRKVIFRKK